MADVYASYLRSPGAQLAADASLHYITSTTEILGDKAILKHLQAQAKLLTKKEERVLSTIEQSPLLFVETATTLLFGQGGGAWLPSLDENLLDEKTVTFPVLHVVALDAEQKIKSIRLYWDQSTLLKQVEAIGKTGRNWPIRDGKSQIEAINKSIKLSNSGGAAHATAGATNDLPTHHKQQSVSATRDPHASLNLFAPRDPNEHAPGDYQGPKLAPRASAKPAPRAYNELFAGGEAPAEDPTKQMRSPSPSKDGVVFKSGAGKHYTGNRLFDENEEPSRQRSPERKKVHQIPNTLLPTNPTLD
jgi:hypothetical protein